MEEQRRAHASHTLDGESIETRSVKIIKSDTCSLSTFVRRLTRLSDGFIYHNYIAHKQAASFDLCVDKVSLSR